MYAKFGMDPNKALWHLAAHPDKYDVCVRALSAGANPFYTQKNQSTFEIASQCNNYKLITLFVMYWLAKPSWNLHEEIYHLKDENNIVLIKLIDDMLMQCQSRHTIVRQLLNITHMFLLSEEKLK